ncbi:MULTISPECIES: type I pullulanase [Bacillus]|uniref:type I pullulanase n=1 Tax=Bacillus TaxID=1386 RepID=UPI000BB727F5|nr:MULTISPECIES: type I pullulanase [Bacillus]
MITVKREFEAFIDKLDSITVLLPKSEYSGLSNSFTLETNSLPPKSLRIGEKIDLPDKIKYICQLEEPLQIGVEYWITDEHSRKTDLQIGAVIRTEQWDELFYYDCNDLGVTYSKTDTTFTIWAPSASAVKVKIIELNGNENLYSLLREEKGVWRLTVNGDLEYFTYTFLVCVNLVWREAVDPYSIAVSANVEAGIIINPEKTRMAIHPLPPFKSITDAIIYELHVRDFSIHAESGLKQKGKYLAFLEEGTKTSSNHITGLNYLEELGITHVELLPINTFGGVDELHPDKQYNWGYNPLLFNVPQGSYATSVTNPLSRIKELKQLVDTFHKKNIRVIVDVVYNHVFIREESSFEKIVPGYYFRHDEHGMPSNGTGVGNDIASERKMVRKFILDSILYWIKEFDVDGFRFDLMGILDIDTMNDIRNAVDEVKSGCILLGEGWELNTPIRAEQKAMISNAQQMQGISFFNDRFRDGIKGSTFNLFDRGFALGNTHKTQILKESVIGSICLNNENKGLFVEPTQSINYVESHDNHTLWDKMNICNAHEEENLRIKRHLLATAIVFLSQGVPFIHAGQEFFRTKNGHENSYKSPDTINALDWERRDKYLEQVSYVQGLIALRKSHSAFRFSNASKIRKHFSVVMEKGSLFAYTLKDVQQYGNSKNILVIYNNAIQKDMVKLPGGKWNACVLGEKAGTTTLKTLENSIEVLPVSTTVLIQH